MARAWNRLSAAFVSRKDHKRGRYADGGGVYLQVSKSGTPSFTFHWQRNGTVRTMGLGSARSVSLATVRELAAKAREQLARGLDPIDARKADALEQRAARAKLMTFKQCAEQFHSDNAPRWGNAKHRAEWISTLRRFAFPVIGHLSVAAIDSTLVHKVLLPLVAPKPVTASRVRGRIEMVLDYAKAAGLRSGDNPADANLIKNLLPLRPEKARVVHQPALPFAKLPVLMQVLRATEGKAARLLELNILSGMRFNAVHAARFKEFDLDDAETWTVPSVRMKSLGRDHKIPLGPRAVQIVRDLRAATNDDALFAGLGKNAPGKVLTKLLQDIGHTEHVVPHGFRSCLKDWAHEWRDYPTEVVEMALGHVIANRVEAAYRRGDLFDRRKLLMFDWEDYCGGVETDKVVKLRA